MAQPSIFRSTTISIHALRAERDVFDTIYCASPHISIHALRAERDIRASLPVAL